MCGCALSVMWLTLAVVLSTPHDYSGTFQEGYSARFTASRRAREGVRRSSETAKKNAGPIAYTQCVYTIHTHNIIICIHTHTHTSIHPYTHQYTNVYTHTYLHVVYTHANIYVHTYKVILTQTYTYVLCVHMHAQPTHNRTPITGWHDINTPWPVHLTMARTPHTHG